MPTAKELGCATVKWDLKDLETVIKDKKIETVLADQHKKAKAFSKKYKGKLNGIKAEVLQVAYKEFETILTPLYKLSQYVHLQYSLDTQDDKIKSTVALVNEKESEIFNELVFFDLELGSLPTETVKALQKKNALGDYIYSFNRTIKTAKHNLSEAEERLNNLKSLTGAQAFKKLYGELTASFMYEFEVDGEKKTLNGSELRALRQHTDPKIRRDAMALFYTKYEENKLVITHCFNNIIKNTAIDVQLRGYSSAINRKNTGNDLPDKAIDILHDVTTDSNKLVQRYYKLKSKILNLPDLTLADIYAPMPQSAHTFSFSEAKEIVLDGFSKFDTDFYKMAKTMFDEKRVDAPVTPTKRGGAFCSSSTPDVNPYVMLNYLGRQRDVSTMAHEFGHAIHAMLSQKQSLMNYHAILPLCETASVFCEMIITDKLLNENQDPLFQQALLTDKLEDIFATSHRQNMFSRFERQTHAQIKDSIMSTKELCGLYQKELKKMFGTAVIQPQEYQWEWSSIPHMFESPFYVYSYNFGNLLVMALYQKYLESGKSFIPKLKAFLSAGSVMSPKEICKLVDADIEDPEFWQKSIDYIASLLKRLESITIK